MGEPEFLAQYPEVHRITAEDGGYYYIGLVQRWGLSYWTLHRLGGAVVANGAEPTKWEAVQAATATANEGGRS